MAVKELVGLFEPSPYTDISPGVGTSRRRAPHPSILEIDDPPPPRLARFLHHPRPPSDTPITDEQGGSRFDSDTTLTEHDNNDEEPLMKATLDVTEAHNIMGGNSNIATISDFRTILLRPPVGHEAGKDAGNEHNLHNKHSYPPVSKTRRPLSLTPIRRQSQRCSPHVPVPTRTLFARRASPLYLPKLDDFLASHKPPKFTMLEEGSTGDKFGKPTMFPPMERLAASGLSIEELEINSRSPGWRNRGTILGAIVNVVLGFTVSPFLDPPSAFYLRACHVQGSSALATYYSLQGLFNTVQVFALLLSTVGKPAIHLVDQV